MGFSTCNVSTARIKGIYREAITLSNKGWVVLANYIPKYGTPPEIEGFTPDIYALKENLTCIVMVESYGDSDPKRNTIFRIYSRQFVNTVFMLYQVNAAGSRII